MPGRTHANRPAARPAPLSDFLKARRLRGPSGRATGSLPSIVDAGAKRLNRAHVIGTICLLILVSQCMRLVLAGVELHNQALGISTQVAAISRRLSQSPQAPSVGMGEVLQSLSARSAQLVEQDRITQTTLIYWLLLVGAALLVKGLLLSRYLVDPLQRAAQLARASADEERARKDVEARERELRLQNRELERLAGTNVLTGLPNRRALITGLRRESDRLAREAKPLGVLMIDIDHFKALNDDHGHAAGDEALQYVAQSIQRNIRITDLAARYGGEEFVVLLPGAGEVDTAEVAEVIRESIAAAPWHQGHLQVSIGGVSAVPEFDGDALIRAADRALYDAKRAGRNRTVMGHVNPRPTSVGRPSN